jgi:hypothetical protein
LISVLLTRTAVAVLVFFLAQILLGLYRYNARLEHYFTGRADALALKGEFAFDKLASRQEVLLRLMNSLSAQSVDFGKVPNSPTQDALDLAKTILRAARPK